MPDYLDRRPNEYYPVAARPSFLVVADDQVEAHRGALALMSSVKRRGVWTLAKRFRIAAVMAEAKIDLREARISSHSEIEVFAFWASIEIIVPPGIRVDVQDSALMGEVNWESTDNQNLSHDAPSVLIRGSVIMSSVEVKVRYLGETDREAKRRLKAARG
ncbi:MAG TPA: LiaF domain-containing protein [Gemmatimonadaceae bacterium]